MKVASAEGTVTVWWSVIVLVRTVVRVWRAGEAEQEVMSGSQVVIVEETTVEMGASSTVMVEVAMGIVEVMTLVVSLSVIVEVSVVKTVTVANFCAGAVIVASVDASVDASVEAEVVSISDVTADVSSVLGRSKTLAVSAVSGL